MENKNFEWVDYYEEFAEKLLQYKNNRKELIEKIKRAYNDAKMKFPKLERDGNVFDIDPFTVFGLFNKGMSHENRKKIMDAFSKEFGLKSKVPYKFFVPTLMAMNAMFYSFADKRGKHDIDYLWDFFEASLKYAHNPNKENKTKFVDKFNIVINLPGNGNSKQTMALFWIASDIFIPLDRRSRWFIYESGRIPKEDIEGIPVVGGTETDGKTYLEVSSEMKKYLQSNKSEWNNFRELSLESYEYSQKVNEEKKREEKIKEAALADADVNTERYWIYSPGTNAEKWDEFYNDDVMAIGWGEIGDLSQFESKEEMRESIKDAYDSDSSHKNDALATWEFANVMKPGDIIFVKKGMHQIVGRGIVDSDYYFDDSKNTNFSNFRKVKWTDNGKWDSPVNLAVKTLSDITNYTDYVTALSALFEDDIESNIEYPFYSKDDFLNEVFMNEDEYHTLIELVKNKKNVILQGAPGVGKTFVAKRLAYSMIGEKNQDRVMLVQFHQSYSYEDFIEGFRPSADGNGFVIKKGSFYNFCKKAEDDLDNDYFFIIDEINRGNLSKIFGELFMLIENDKRGNSLQLLYSDEKFNVPKNVYIIGMMNTADRSLALVDYALRRRFSFYNLKPAFTQETFVKYCEGIQNKKFHDLVNCIVALNDEIANDESLGKGFCIGHSYLCGLGETAGHEISNIVNYEIIPLLEEYWFDEPEKLDRWKDRLKGVL